MASGSRKDQYDPEQYERQLEHSRRWKAANRERVRQYDREYRRARRAATGSDDPFGDGQLRGSADTHGQ